MHPPDRSHHQHREDRQTTTLPDATHNVEATENNYQAYLNDSLECEGLQATIMVCEGTAITSAGTEEPVHMEWTVDVDGQRYVKFSRLLTEPPLPQERSSLASAMVGGRRCADVH